MTINNILTRGGLNTMSFSTICIFRDERLFANQQNAIANFKLLECIVVCTVTGCL